MSACRAGPPVPSTRLPPRITKSCITSPSPWPRTRIGAAVRRRDLRTPVLVPGDRGSRSGDVANEDLLGDRGDVEAVLGEHLADRQATRADVGEAGEVVE